MSPEQLREYLLVCRNERVLRAQIPTDTGPLVIELTPQMDEPMEPPVVAGGWKTPLTLDNPFDLGQGK